MKTVTNQFEITRNSYKDEGDGIVSFANGLCISDNEVQRDGTKYDIDSLDISKYQGQLTADHEDKLKNIIGRVEGVKKENGRLTINKIVYAIKQNPYARLAYDLLVGGFSNSFSTETIGPAANADGTLAGHELVGLSQVVCPNNYSAVVNTVHNSLERAKEDGLDIDGVEEMFLNSVKVKEENSMTKIKNENEEVVKDEIVEETTEEVAEVENSTEAQLEVAEAVVEETESETEQAEAEVENAAKKEEDKEEVEDDSKDEEKEEPAEEKAEETEEKSEEEVEDKEDEDKEEKKKNDISAAQVKELFDKLDNLAELVSKSIVDDEEVEVKGVEEIVKEDLNAVEEKEENTINEEEPKMTKEEMQNAIAEALKGYFANDAKAPEFQKAENSVEYSDLNWKERYQKQVNAAWDMLKANDVAATAELRKINEVNFNALKEAGLVANAMTIASMGNFVIPPEMYKEIVGQRTDYSAILDATSWRETNSLEYAWLERNGDIDMKNVALCDDGQDGNLKPVSEYAATPKSEKLEELAAVTVVCNAATRFFAVDLLADVAAGYRNDYDRKRAQLVIAKIEQAVDASGNETVYAPTTDTEAMVAWLEAISDISDTTTNGTLIFNNKTFAQLKAHALEAGVDGPLSHIFTDGQIPQIFGTPYIVVPNDLMPTIESTDKISYFVNGKEVSIDHAVFYVDLSEFVGFTSGGLQYDLADQASYEVNGTVRSAYQRNELVLRGSFFRGGAFRDKSRASGILQQGKTPAES